jgi:heptosyltransferase-2
VPAASPSRIVVLAPNWLGDLVMALPAIASVRAWQPAEHLAVAARSGIAPLLTLAGGVDEVVPLERPADGGDAAPADARQRTAGSMRRPLLNSTRGAARAACRHRRALGVSPHLRGRLLTRAIDPPKASMPRGVLSGVVAAPALPRRRSPRA